MASIVESIRGEYIRYKALADAAFAQLEDAELSAPGPNGGNSVAVIAWHVAGNLRSRFTEFLTSDGEKPWRDREEEFRGREVTREELVLQWNRGWDVLIEAISGLTDDHLDLKVTIRQQPLTVSEALHRSLAHCSYHVGQIVYLAKSIRGAHWKYLSIPPGKSNAYNASATLDRPADQAAALSRRDRSTS